MTDAPWFKFWVEQERALLDVLNDEQYLAHVRLRLYAWTTGGLPDTEAQLRKIARASAVKWARIWPALCPYWTPADGVTGRLVNDRQEADRLSAEMRTHSGRNAAAKRWQCERNANALASQCGPNAIREEKKREEKIKTDSEPRALAIVAPAREGAFDLSPGQLQAAVPGLVGAWNNIAAVLPHPFKEVQFRSHPKATRALHAHPDIDWWSDLFRRVVASDYLRGQVPLRDGRTFLADMLWVLDHCEEIAAGRYDNRLTGNAAVLDRVLKDLA